MSQFSRGASAGFLILLAATLFVLFSRGSEAQLGSPRGTIATTKKRSPEKDSQTQYAVGTVNGVKLWIPKYYLLHGVVYEGGERIGLGAASSAVTQNSRIDNFGILVRLSTFQPIQSVEDREDWKEASMHADLEKKWLMVAFDNHYPPPSTPPLHAAYMISRWGPYIPDKKLPYGLVHYESTQSVEDGMKNSDLYGHVEYFFDDASMTAIFCQTTRMVVPPFSQIESCEHRFLVPDLHLMAEAFYTKKDLSRWVEIEGRMRAIANSFIVQ
jgi:hypothetical protein